MPRLAKRACSVRGCPNLHRGRRGLCHEHEKAEAARYEREQRVPWKRPPGWAKTRAQVLSEEPICSCGRETSEVDHILHRGQGGTDDRSNLMARCLQCHSSKSAKSGERWG